MTGSAIEAQDLTRRFGPHTALERLDLRIPAGASFGLLGANGAGKTTFLRLVAGLLLPTAGRLTVGGRSPASDPPAVQARLGLVMETRRLYPGQRVRGFLRFLAAARGLRGAGREAAVDREIERFGLGEVAARRIGSLSLGFRQRVSLAQAFLHDPPLVVVDEPTNGLDPLQQAEVRDLLRGLAGERTVLVCTHDLAEARALATRVAVLRAGRLVTEGPTAEVLERDDTLALFRGEGPAA